MAIIPQGQAKLVTMNINDVDTPVVVVMVQQRGPNGQMKVAPQAFTKDDLNNIIASANMQHETTLSQANALLAMFPVVA